VYAAAVAVNIALGCFRGRLLSQMFDDWMAESFRHFRCALREEAGRSTVFSTVRAFFTQATAKLRDGNRQQCRGEMRFVTRHAKS